MPMDMPSSPEEFAELPEGEQKFISLIINGNFAAYGAGFKLHTRLSGTPVMAGL